ncbi:putative phage abortive infection protein [Photobacterium galatheae]|uniref:Phage abortive infection protein n=1 Tax=Photobacterium galatheae TaxID=1654360 RepID=A0A066RPU8_9GAMM|nr:putative phage abortive infection protein [Photobacterium galatheae]KDM89662.1 hypothetical protein EA58_21285 [Photobacterium galatheae]MCM0151703.1 putative phage abortive infection protein [Photobacterium galatheae]
MSSEKKSGFMGYLLIPMLLAVISIAWFFYPSWMGYVFTPKETVLQGDLGTLGDSFGALNTLFSGFAFAGIIVSIYLQSKELKETREEIKAQGEQFKLQTQALNKQNFETTFFQLLSLYNEILNSIYVEHKFGKEKSKIFGREAVKVLYMNKFMDGEYRHYLYYNGFKDEPITEKHIQYLDFHRVYGSVIGHYFRNIYQILKFVDESSVVDKKLYTNLLRAQLSSSELALLFYNCLSEIGSGKFKCLIEKYNFLEHLPPLQDIDVREVTMYKKEAFGKSNHKYLADFGKVQFETE